VKTESKAPRLARIQLHPIKSLDPIEVPEARIGPNGGLEFDRAWALYTADGRWVNAKRTSGIHRVRAAYAADLRSVTLSALADGRNMFTATLAFPRDTEQAAEWFSAYFEQQIIVRYAREGFPDDGLAPGPTIISTASLQTVCEWFPGMTLEEVRRRFRATLEIDGDRSAAAQGVDRVGRRTQRGPLPYWRCGLRRQQSLRALPRSIARPAYGSRYRRLPKTFQRSPSRAASALVPRRAL
jgi:hypothetical protein